MTRLALGLAMLCAVGSAFGADEFRDVHFGEWAFDIDYTLIGIPQRFEPFTVRQCISEQNLIPDISRHGQECIGAPQGRFGSTVTWSLNCSTEWEMVQGLGRVHYMDERATGDVHMMIIHPFNPAQPMVYHLKGKYIGPCKDGGQSK